MHVLTFKRLRRQVRFDFIFNWQVNIFYYIRRSARQAWPLSFAAARDKRDHYRSPQRATSVNTVVCRSARQAWPLSFATARDKRDHCRSPQRATSVTTVVRRSAPQARPLVKLKLGKGYKTLNFMVIW